MPMRKSGFILAALALLVSWPVFAQSLDNNQLRPFPLPTESCDTAWILPTPKLENDTLISEICADGKSFEPFEAVKVNPIRKGINTTDPQATLDVNGGIKIGNDTAPCTAQKAGTIRFTETVFEGCDGKAWVSLQVGKGK